MKLIIAGGRNYVFSGEDYGRLDSINHAGDVQMVISGGASGADRCGEKWARTRAIDVTVVHADWDKHGRAAGPLRNRKMAQMADAVALFPGGRGTASMYSEASLAGLKIFDFRGIKEARRG